ncbi:MAG TPA: HAD-IA family hydrolase [Actinomycetota bacterium]|nr:HAD-IA family hydrolase [Actinomycetota bacterium]
MPGAIDVVFLDIGGVLYDDRVYAEAWRRALREAGAGFADEEFDAEYAACRAAQSDSFRRRLATRFVGPGADLQGLERRASAYWTYPPTALHDDVAPALDALAAAGYRLGVIANQPSRVRDAMARDGLVARFEIWGVSDDLGLSKPDPALFLHAIRTARVAPERSVMVGDRLDYDVRPARAAGMRTVWVLRGEAPDDPTPAQLAEPDAAVADLRDLPATIDRLAS